MYLKYFNIPVGDPCRMPVSSGNGNAVLNRWYYNTQSQICVNFVYSGQGGNSNNFRTHEECTEACPEFRFDYVLLQIF